MVGLYFHIPFCKHKCPYCHFYVLPNKEDLQEIFKAAITRELEMRLPLFNEVTSVYFGGGTPSKLPADFYAFLLDKCPLKNRAEITLEVNPEDANIDYFRSLLECGINRISIGVQSFDEELLSKLQRTHDGKRAKNAILDAERAGFKNISIDLMYDLPLQTEKSWINTFNEVRNLPLTHLSLYNLVFEPGSVFFAKRKTLTPLLPDESLSLFLLNYAISALEAMNLHRYEISAFAKERFEAEHNSSYWTGRPFLGLGPSAFSYWGKKRFRNIPHLTKYADALSQGLFPIDFEEELPYPHNLHELIAIHLRLLKGVDLTHYPLPPESLATLHRLVQEGWLTQEDSHFRLTEKGLLFYDHVASEIV